MWRVLLFSAVFACGGAKAQPSASATEPRAATPTPAPRRAITIADMPAAFPADVGVIMAADVVKLRSSPLAHKIWDVMRDHEWVKSMLESSCGGVKELKYVMAGMSTPDASQTWMWMRGIARDAELKACSKETLESLTQSKTTTKGSYALTEGTNTTEMGWDDHTTALVVYHRQGSKPVGAEVLQRAIDAGRTRRIVNADLAAVLEKADTDAGIWMVALGSAVKLEGITAIVMSLDLDRGARARLYMVFESEDRASELAAGYRNLLPKLEQQGLVESAEARADGRALTGSISINAAQADWWLQRILQQQAGSTAQPPPTPSRSSH